MIVGYNANDGVDCIILLFLALLRSFICIRLCSFDIPFSFWLHILNINMFHTWFLALHHHIFLSSIDIINSMWFPQTKNISNEIKYLLGNMNNVEYTTSFITRKK